MFVAGDDEYDELILESEVFPMVEALLREHCGGKLAESTLLHYDTYGKVRENGSASDVAESTGTGFGFEFGVLSAPAPHSNPTQLDPNPDMKVVLAFEEMLRQGHLLYTNADTVLRMSKLKKLDTKL